MKTKKKVRISLTGRLLVPVVILWIVALVSNIQGLTNIRKVNATDLNSMVALVDSVKA